MRTREIFLRVLDDLRGQGVARPSHRIVKCKGDCLFIGTDDETIDFVIKIRAVGMSWLNTMRSNRFKTEICILEQLRDHRFDHVKTPVLVVSDFSDFFVTRYVDGSHPVICGTYCHLIVSAIHEFNTSVAGANMHRGRLQMFGKNLLTQAARSAFRLMVWPGGVPVSRLMRGLLLAARLYRQQPALPAPYLLHGDLGNTGNCIMQENGDIYLIDFGGARLEWKFILFDVVTAALNMSTLTFDFRSVNEYVKLLTPDVQVSIDPKLQIHFCLLLRFFYLLSHQPEDYLRGRRQQEFLVRVLLDEKVFGAWFEAGLRTGSLQGSYEPPVLRDVG